MNLEQHGRNQKTKKKSPRTHLSQVWSPAFRLPWIRSRLKPELRTSPQRRGGRLWERRYPVHHEDAKNCKGFLRVFVFSWRDFLAAAGLLCLQLCSSVVFVHVFGCH